MKPCYDKDGITVYHGDCRDILPTLDAVDHVITDPPYEAEAHTQQRRASRGSVLEVEPLAFDPITADVRALVGLEAARLARRWVLTFCQVEAAPDWRCAYERGGLTYRRTCIWHKPDGQPQYSGDRPGMGYETFVAMHQPGRSQWNGGGRHGVFVINKGSDGTANVHQTQKPISLMRELVELFTDPGDLVLDPFAGSLTTAVACKQLGRRCIAIEMDEGYVQAGIKRLESTTLPLFVLPPEKATQEAML